MSKEKVKMQEQSPEVRITNFKEVTCGYTLEEAMEEAGRCLHCKHKPCVNGCPVGVPIPEFIKAVTEGNIEEGYQIISEENRLPAICGRVCPQESQCEGVCVRGLKGEPVAIGRLERFVADYYMKNMKKEVKQPNSNGKSVAIVGGGPASLTCAADLAKRGYEVTMYEALHELGGVLMYGIPEFRLPKDLVREELQGVIDLGVKVEMNVVVGRSITIEELFEDGFQAVFVGSGAGLPTFMKIEGENLNGVYSANEFLTRVNLMKAYDPNSPTPVRIGEKVAVIGGGNVAMDAARTAKRLGAKEVKIVYRRNKEELPARQEEVHHAEEEQIILDLLKNPLKILGKDGHVKAMECIKMVLGEPDESGRRGPQPVPGSEEVMEVDTVIIAIGQTPNPLLRDTTEDLDVNKWDGIVVNEETMETTMDNVYAGGDAVSGAATVILAMGAGKQAAKSIHERLNKW